MIPQSTGIGKQTKSQNVPVKLLEEWSKNKFLILKRENQCFFQHKISQHYQLYNNYILKTITIKQ